MRFLFAVAPLVLIVFFGTILSAQVIPKPGSVSDVSALVPSTPKIAENAPVGSFMHSEFTDGVARNGYAYLVSYAGIAVLDIADPSAPRLVRELLSSNNMNCHPNYGYQEQAVIFIDTLLYVSGGCEGIRIFSLSDPSNPARIATFRPWDPSFEWDFPMVNAMCLRNNILYCCTLRGLYVVDVSKPGQPATLSSFPWPDCGPIHLSDQTLYVGGAYDGVIYAVDISEPSAPVVQDTITPFSCDVPFWCDLDDIATVGSSLLAAKNTGYGLILKVVDVTDPHNAVVIDSIILPGWAHANIMQTFDSTVFVFTDSLYQFQLLPNRDLVRSGATGLSLSSCESLTRSDSLLWLLGSGMTLYRLSETLTPVVLGQYRATQAQCIVTYQGVAFVGGRDPVLSILDISDPYTHDLLGSLDQEDAVAGALCMDYPYVYVATTQPGGERVYAVNVENYASPVRADSIFLSAKQLVVSGAYIYALSDWELTILFRDGLGQLDLLGQCAIEREGIPIAAERIAVSGSTVVASSSHCVILVDVSDRQDPRVVGSYCGFFPYGPTDVVASAEIAYVAGCDSALSIADPSQPTLIPDSHTGLSACRNLVQAGHIVIGNSYSRLIRFGGVGLPNLVRIDSCTQQLGGDMLLSLAAEGQAVYEVNEAGVIQYQFGAFLQPTINISPTNLSFEAERESDPHVPGSTLSIANVGVGTLSWQVTSSVGWLEVSPSFGYDDANVTVSIMRTDLPPGFYSGKIKVASNDPNNPLIEIHVQYEVWEPIVPVVLVHGWTAGPHVWESMANAMAVDQFDYVWRVQLDPCGSLSEKEFSQDVRLMYAGNAKILGDFIELQLSNLDPDIRRRIENVDIIAHSMGGLVTRRYMNRIAGIDNWTTPVNVRKLVMLATPNNGSEAAGWLAKKVRCNDGPAALELGIKPMLEFNKQFDYRAHTSPGVTDYYVIWGDKNCTGWGFSCGFVSVPGLLVPCENDGLVADWSAKGGAGSAAYRNFRVSLCHSDFPSDQYIYTTYVRPILQGMLTRDAELPETVTLVAAPVIYDYEGIASGPNPYNDSFYVENNSTLQIAAFYPSTTATLTLRTPSGSIIDSQLASVDPSVAYLYDSTGSIWYEVQGTQAGYWHWALTMQDAAFPAEFAVAAGIDNGVQVSTGQSSRYLSSTDSLLLTVDVDGGAGPIAGLQVEAVPVWNDTGSGSALLFRDDGLYGDVDAGDGTYSLRVTGLAEGLVEFRTTISGEGPDGFLRRIAEFYASVTAGCCAGTTGNVNGSAFETPDLSDLSLLISYLTQTPRPTLPCLEEANVNGSSVIDLTDLSMLIAYLTTTPRPVLPSCP